MKIQNLQDIQLGSWVSNQRTAYKNKSITKEHLDRLNYIGFAWVGKAPWINTATWEEIYQQLVAYKKEHKNTKVPQSYKEDPKLGTWVSKQRTAYNTEKTTEERKLVLTSLCFLWDLKA